ncbi:unnamed protein product [Pleuronectes platessa]|uniref:Uncharacterized protein n=1 Tax=Pleuronectes platessa TaxID=8262 RepID=A0A9N7V4H4_PLEPL|nr:unnamed protein product [Pleuronectes platessa]
MASGFIRELKFKGRVLELPTLQRLLAPTSTHIILTGTARCSDRHQDGDREGGGGTREMGVNAEGHQAPTAAKMQQNCAAVFSNKQRKKKKKKTRRSSLTRLTAAPSLPPRPLVKIACGIQATQSVLGERSLLHTQATVSWVVFSLSYDAAIRLARRGAGCPVDSAPGPASSWPRLLLDQRFGLRASHLSPPIRHTEQENTEGGGGVDPDPSSSPRGFTLCYADKKEERDRKEKKTSGQTDDQSVKRTERQTAERTELTGRRPRRNLNRQEDGRTDGHRS